jgi:RHS repeat-associated protein
MPTRSNEDDRNGQARRGTGEVAAQPHGPRSGSAVPGSGASPGLEAPQGQVEKPSMLPAVSVPKGGGAIRGIGEKFAVGAATGSASLSVPLPASPGRAGFGPQVALGYDTGNSNGPFGIGFTLSVPAISRKTDKGLPRYYDGQESDEFVLSGEEDLIPNRIPDGSTGKLKLEVLDKGDHLVQRYRPRVEGLFARIERRTAKADGVVHWQMTTKDNVTHFYGRSVATQIADPKDPSRVFSWLLEESRDDRGNIVQYVYKPENGSGVDPTRTSERSRFETIAATRTFTATAQRYLKRVRYGNFVPGQASDFLFEMVFDYGDHPGGDAPTPVDVPTWPVRIDPFSSYRSGFEVRTYRLCTRVLMFHRLSDDRRPVLVRSTDFAYKPGPAFTYLTAITQRGYLFDEDNNLVEPPLETPRLDLAYYEPTLKDELAVLPRASLEGLEGGVTGGVKQWVDLDGEGIPGVLIDSDRAWFYKANAGGGQLAPPVVLRTLPAPSTLQSGTQQLQDLAGDGQLDLVTFGAPISGFASRTPDGDFDPLRTFPTMPIVDWRDPNLRFIDVDGDGLVDVLVTQEDAFVWYRSLGKGGFEPAQRTAHANDEDRGPAVVFADDTQSVQLVDMSGDGLVDIVRVRNGEVCYWPNLGYGHFGAKVTLEASPVFAGIEEFDARRIRFGDVDGSGTSDIFYLGATGVTLYFNQSGNALSPPTPITSLPVMDSAGQVDVVDLLGTGTAALVWSSPLPRDAQRSIMYVDLMGGLKPHLLKSVVNNLGAETQISYAPSTKFYLADKAAGIPWLTRLSFPVHVVERVDAIDAISKSHVTTTYRYRHGFFDGVEREFHGFARVEQLDAEQFTVGAGTTEFQRPTRTVSWFHTGAWLEKESFEKALAKEYFQQGPAEMLLADTFLTGALTIQDEREAARALRGRMLRQEVYADDPLENPTKFDKPFSVTEQSFEVRQLQTSKGWRHGVVYPFQRETIGIQTERNATDPRVLHDITLDVDDFGNVTRAAAIAYARSVVTQPEQAKPWATLTVMTFINNPGDDADPTQDFFRLGLPVETTKFELTNLPDLPLAGEGLYTRAELESALASIDTDHDLAFEEAPPATGVSRRLLDHKQQLYYANQPDGTILGAAPLNQTGSLGLPFETYQLALTAGLVDMLIADAAPFGGSTGEAVPLPALLIGTAPGQGFYVTRPGDTGYWTRSGQIQFDAGNFYLPTSLTDPFNQQHLVAYDPFNLMVARTEDPLGNITQVVYDYRVLAPSLTTDANRNRVAVAFDALGRVIKTAVMGKSGENLGDTLDNPTTAFEYQLLRWQTSKEPAFVHARAREAHGASPPPRFQESYTYSDGFGRVVMMKIQAEAGPLFDAAGNVVVPLANPRWVGSGRTVFNNKGNAVKQYEPFFSATFAFEDEAAVVQAGVTPIIHHDALDRVVRIELPNGTESRVDFDAWLQSASDPNDTVIGTTWYSSRGAPDPDGGPPADPEQRAAWQAARTAGTPTVTHFDTLGRPFLVVQENRSYANDVGPATEDVFFETRTVLDVEGNALAIIDARQAQRAQDDPLNPPPVATITQRFDVLSRTQRIDSKDAGTRLMLPDAGGKPLRHWDSRHQIFRHRHDPLQRPSHLFVQKTAAESTGQPGETPDDLSERLLLRTIYGEALDPAGPAPVDPDPPSAAQALNLRGQVYLVYDCAGEAKNDRFDFKGNLLSSTRRLAADFTTEPKWNTAPNDLTNLTSPSAVQAAANNYLDPPSTSPLTVFTTTSEYDALNRITRSTTPDLSVTFPTYNAAGLLEAIEVSVRGGPRSTVIANIDYNARGQRLLYEYADPTVTPVPAAPVVTCRVSYSYDPFTFRLTKLKTDRLANSAVTPAVPAAKLQELLYTYDPVGNVVQVDDAADTSPIFSGTTPVTGRGLYRYDSIYRVIQADGREHPGQTNVPTQPRGNFEIPMSSVPHPNDLQALLRFREKYSYDQIGNVLEIDHTTSTDVGGPAGPIWTQWTRTYQYDADSNRLLGNNEYDPLNNPSAATYQYTGNGAFKSMSHLPVMEWDYADRLRHANRGSGGGDVFFTYDVGGQRVRKVFRPSTSTTLTERIYIGGWETFRSRAGGTITSPVTLERETLHVIDDQRRVAMVETTTVGSGPAGPRWRFQLGNMLGSAVMELDPQGRVISYEEYHPFGSTAFQTSGSTEVSPKRYRFTDKEKDEETGLYYHGARYYVPWLGRWSAADPLAIAAPLTADLNAYAYARGNPLTSIDPTGLDDESPAAKQGKAAGEAAFRAGRLAGHTPIVLKQGFDKAQEFEYKAGDVTVKGYFIPGQTKEVALIYGGIHQSEKAATELGEMTLESLKKGDVKPYFTTIIIPDIFGGQPDKFGGEKGERRLERPLHPEKDPFKEGKMDPNRSFPKVGTGLSESPKHGDQPLDARPDGKEPIPLPVQQIIRIREQFQPKRILQLHGIKDPPGKLNQPGITSDRRPGFEAEDAQLTRDMVAEASKLGARLPGNKGGSIDYPTKAVGKEKGVTGGMYFSRDVTAPGGTVIAPAANVILIETYNNQRSTERKGAERSAIIKDLNALRSSILNVFIQR